MSERHEFKTEARQLLDLMIHSVYSNRDIFLRELISNASDAIDKRRFESVKHPDLLPAGLEPAIRVDVDAAVRTLSVSDDGIGMSRGEVAELIGTIAKSGTQEFLKRVRESKDAAAPAELIGQFGVGFYSSFMATDRVTLLTRRAGEMTATLWESSGDGYYTLDEAERESVGTTVTLHLKPADPEDGMKDYADEGVVRHIIRQYSDFVAYPIQMEVEETETTDGQETKVRRTETLNSMKAIWLRDKAEVTEEEYNEFYRHVSHDWTDPLLRVQARIEGTLEYRLLLYVPAKAPWDLFMRHPETHRGVRLYVKRIFIMDDCDELLPEYLRFIRGVVDSEDLPLNISREILQQNRQVQRMSRGIVGKVLDAFKELAAKDADKYKTFWAEFGRVLKEGLFADTDNRDSLLSLLRVVTTASGGESVPLSDYLGRMRPGQEQIYFLCGESRARLERSPHLEAFRDKGYEVLLLDDPVDEVWTSAVFEHEGKKFQSAARGLVNLPDGDETKQEAESERKEQEKAHASLLGKLGEHLSGSVKEVRFSTRLTESPACLVTDAGDASPQLEKMLRAMGQELPPTQRILEVNSGHPLLDALQRVYDADPESPALADYAKLLHGQALLAEGGQLADPAEFARLVADLMVKAAG